MNGVLFLLANGFEEYEASAFKLPELLTDRRNCSKIKKFMGF
jgi:hypothetical protein